MFSVLKSFLSQVPSSEGARDANPKKASQSRLRRPIVSFAALSLLGLMAATLTLGFTGCNQSTPVVSMSSKKGLGYNPAAAPVLNAKASTLDFDYPSSPPSLKMGKEVFNQNCLACHTTNKVSFADPKYQRDFLYATPIDLYLFLTTGQPPVLKEETDVRKQIRLAKPSPEQHRFREKLTRDQRWAAVFYSRYLAGANHINHAAASNNPDIAAIYGGNCAVCHGNRGHADGFLHTGHPSKHELAGAKIFGGVLYPPPARFTQYERVFNRTDAQWFKYLCEGIYPSAMPAWLGNVDKDKNFVFDETVLWMLVKHVRTLAIQNDLTDDVAPSGLVPAKGSVDQPPLDLKIPPVSKLDLELYKRAIQKEDYFKSIPSRMPLLKEAAKGESRS